jgi:predicted nucleic acid-binding protein
MDQPLLIDTDVLVDYLRGREEAVGFLTSQRGDLLVSVLTVAELHAGLRHNEESALSECLRLFRAVPVDAETAAMGGSMRRAYLKSHDLGLADALIAASVQRAGALLVTLNRRHYPMLAQVLVPYRKA